MPVKQIPTVKGKLELGFLMKSFTVVRFSKKNVCKIGTKLKDVPVYLVFPVRNAYQSTHKLCSRLKNVLTGLN